MEDTNVYCRVILEMLGAPKNYIEQTMKDYIAKIKKEGITITKERYEDATLQGTLYTTFVELELNFKTIPDLLAFCFEALPSSVEILTPSTLVLPAAKLTDFLNDLQARLHDADMIIKSVRAQNKILDNNATAVFNNFITHLTRQGPATLETLSRSMGVTHKELQPFLNKLIENKKISFDGTTYTITR